MGLPLLPAVPLVAALLAYWLFKIASFFYGYWTSTVRRLPGPPSLSFVYGNEKEVFDGGTALLKKWVERYGPTIHLQSFIGMSKLYTTDLKALNHIFMNSYTYQKPEWFRYRIQEVTGKGLLTVEEDTHRRQRKVANPAFSATQIRELSGIFIEKSLELRDIWEAEIHNQGGIAKIDISVGLNRAALDIIGLAGFNYNFNALSDGENSGELQRAFADTIVNLLKFSPVSFLRAAFPALRWLPARAGSGAQTARNIMDDIGRQLIATGKQTVSDSSKADGNPLKNKDLLTVLLRANMATDIPDNQKMSDEEVLAQIFTVFGAGHETVSTATVWALYALMKAPNVQKRLREELLEVSSDSPSPDELNALPYLDAVIREALRLHPPLPLTFRISVKDDVLPLSTPVRDRSGRIHESIHIQKGQMIMIPIGPVNEEKAIWGEDSLEFRPERWESVPEAANAIPGVWSNSMAFIGGPRACIGYRFAVLEMKALLFSLIRAFEFEPAGPIEDIGRKFFIVHRPFLKSDPEAGTQMPLKVRRYHKM